MARIAAAMLVGLLLAACSSTPVPSRPPLTGATPEAIVATIRAAASGDDAELAVQPLRDPMVEDLRQQAQRLEGAHQYPQAAAALDHALSLVPDDPALLQERAEAAILQGDFATAERLARHAQELGSKVGPLCRRHWTTMQQMRLVDGDAAGADAARVQADACTVAAPNRF
jgi:Flp pilus assembly protein TadD